MADCASLPLVVEEEIKKPSMWLSLPVLVSTGMVFGFAMSKGQVVLPYAIIDQMTLSRFTMMKLFIGGLGASLIAEGMVRIAQPQIMAEMRAARDSTPRAPLVSIAGGLVLGIGMTLSGSCPGTVYVQLGAQVPSAWACFLGVVLGTVAGSAVQPMVTSWQSGKSKLSKAFDLCPFPQMALGIVFLGMTTLLERLTPEPSAPWNPSVAGMVVGALQLPLALLLHKSLGTSGAVRIVLGETVGRLGKLSWFPRAADIGQAVFAVGIVAGAVCAGSYQDAAVPSVARSIVGGTLIALGASVAGGCTSGHGFSGCGMLMRASWLTLPFIFAGAMGTGLILSFF